MTSHAEIEEFLRGLEADQQRIIDHAVEINWLQRGGIPWDQIWRLTLKERQSIIRQGESRMKMVKETRIPII